MTTTATWSQALIDHGKRADTPAAIVRRCSLPDQQTFFTTLGQLGETVRAKKLRPPAVVIVGEVAQQRDISNWFTSRPLFGRTILITRPEHQSDDLASQFQNLGANVLRQPAIEIRPPSDWSPVDRAIELYLRRNCRGGNGQHEAKNCKRCHSLHVFLPTLGMSKLEREIEAYRLALETILGVEFVEVVEVERPVQRHVRKT